MTRNVISNRLSPDSPRAPGYSLVQRTAGCLLLRFAVPAILPCLAACRSASNPWPSWNKCAPRCKEELGHDPGLEIAYGFLDEGNLESADQILANDWPVSRYETSHLEPPLTWTEDPQGADYWRFLFYSLRSTANLLWAFLPELPSAQVWRALAQNRLDSLLTQAIDPDGVAYEQSTYYNFYILTSLWQILHWSASYALGGSDKLDAAVRSMVAYATYVIQPNGWIPMFGVSQARNIRRYEPEIVGQIAQSDPAFAYVLSAGRNGQEPTDRFVLFKSSRQAILRSGFGPPDQFEAQTHVHFDVGPWRTKHSHLDALSVNVYSAGRILLPDSGYFTEDSAVPEWAYFYGTRGHNTVVVDETDQQPGGCTVGLAVGGGSWSYLSASHALYPGVVHGRSVLLLARDLVLVVDRLLGTGPHTYDQTWHLPPDTGLEQNGTTIVETASSRFSHGPLATLRQAWPEGITVSIAKGSMAPVDGWYSEKELQKEPAYAIHLRKQGPEARFVTLISSGPHAGLPAGFAADGDDRHTVISVCSGDVKLQVTLDQLGGPGEAVQVGPLSACPPVN